MGKVFLGFRFRDLSFWFGYIFFLDYFVVCFRVIIRLILCMVRNVINENGGGKFIGVVLL